ncbi:hypothetical protein C3477_28780 [Mycobacterium kansasii]|uniref:hypothetical protein n=1 Tax=Mycobacterium kansasii TaxID=1768 RepID=UPI000CDDAEE5|nr:hypothetical protein [Mycobacterium kansasii]POX79800.1 hypothetical protein C3B43_27545 [Mycobacterium kansasii]POX90777.1 hypothetical protein C3477_28780 [Mycobacterium kansasii]POY12704.1 hypothetical protein C3476_27740 [Mycobacterium kansasii]POY29938.1 hypothetical protein C3478_23530 [Mycobacterium kansasii]
MKTGDKRLLVVVLCCAAATCAVAGLVTHNRTSTPLTLGEVLVTAVVPLGLLGYLTVYYTRKRVPDDDSTDQNPASR